MAEENREPQVEKLLRSFGVETQTAFDDRTCPSPARHWQVKLGSAQWTQDELAHIEKCPHCQHAASKVEAAIRDDTVARPVCTGDVNESVDGDKAVPGSVVRKHEHAEAREPVGTRDRRIPVVELLVTVAGLWILIALISPAIQAAREASRRSQCSYNLKQLGLGLHNYHDTHAWFPPGVLANGLNAGTTPPTNMSWMPMLLPFMEQSALYEQLLPYMGTRAASDFPSELMNSVIPPLMCPSDSAAPKTGLIHGDFSPPGGNPPDYNDGFSGNYLLCHGNQLVTQNNNPATPGAAFGNDMNGMFYYKSRVRMASVTDGTANTVMGAEIITLPELIAGAHRDWRGRYYRAEHLSSIFSTNQPPNTTLSDYCRTCQAPAVKEAPCVANTDLQYLFARSYHPGGVQAVLADASVRFISNNINTQVWRDLGTREGGESSIAY